jgi:glycosyltransferase involved in cell wall biosynthesis
VPDRQRIASLYATADVLVHPNPREPLGLAPLEAMATGLPVVAPASGGLLEYASSDNAWLTDPLPARFARAVERVLGRPGLTASKVRHAQGIAANLDWRPVTTRYFELYDAIHFSRATPLLPHRHGADTLVH